MLFLARPASALRWLCLLAVVLSLLPAYPAQATAVHGPVVPQAVTRQAAAPVASEGEAAPAAAPALPLLPVAVTLSADPGVLAPGTPSVVTLRVETTAEAEGAMLPPIDVTFTLPDGLLTAEGRTGTLTWSGVQVSSDTPFEQALTVGVAPGNTAAGGQAVQRITARAVAAGYAASAGETLIGVGNNAPAAAAQADGDGAVVQSSDGDVAVLAPGGVLPAGASLQITELFNGEAAALAQLDPASVPAEPGPAVAPASALTATPIANTWLYFPFASGHGDANLPAGVVEQRPPTEQMPAPPTDTATSMFGALSASAVSIATRQEGNLQAFRIFQLDAGLQGAAGSEPTFDGEVLLRMSIAPWLSRGVNPAMLRLWTREQPGESWQPVTTGYDPEQQTLEAWLPHFSQFGLGAGLDTGGDSLPSVKAFTVDALNGGANLHLPIQTPKGLGGLSPNLSFDYSSVTMDDLLREAGEREVRAQASSVGIGWSLGGISYIARADGMADKADAVKEFALVLNGTRTSIVYQGGRWRTNPETFARVVWQGASNDHDNGPGTGSGYRAEDFYGWSVYTPDGMRYEFGDSGTFMGVFNNTSSTATFLAKTNAGADMRLAKRWYLRKVTDPLGNTMEYRYRGEMAEEFYGVGDTWKDAGRAWYTRSIDPTEIYWSGYNSATHSLRVLFGYVNADRADIQIKGNDNDDGLQPLFGVRNQLNTVTVQVLSQGLWQTLTTYTLDQATQTYSGTTDTRLLLNAITQSGKSGGRLSRNSFGYDTPSPNTTVLTSANNGVGGVVNYTYNYHQVSCANSTCPYFAGVATNLRHAVVRTQATDELGNSLHTDYYYGPTNPESNQEWAAVANDGGFLGFQEVQTTTYATNSTDPSTALKWERMTSVEDSSGADASRMNPDPRRGKPGRLEVWSKPPGNDGQLLHATDYDWRAYWLEGSAYGTTPRTTSWQEQNGTAYYPATVVQQYAVTETLYTVEPGYSLPATSTSKLYRYDNEFGNVLAVEEWADGALQRITQTEYFPNVVPAAGEDVTLYIADRPARVRIFDATGVCRSETRLVYDRWQTANTYISKPDKGLLSERDQALTACSDVATLATNDANWAIERFAYDSYGNQTTHHRMAASDGSWDQYVITDYDTVYHLFPVRRLDDGAQTAAYYGVNAISSGESKGLDDPWAYWGSMAEWCDVNEVCVRQAYDEYGRRRFRWDNVGRTAVWSTLSEANAGVQWDYRDPLNNPTWSDTTITEWHAPRCEGNFVRRHYNAFGLLTQEQRPYQGWSMAYQGCDYDAMPAPEVDVDYAYDALGRVVGSVAPNGEATHYQYLGRQTRVLAVGRSAYGEPDKVLKWTEVDGLGRLHRVLTGDQAGMQTAAITLTHDVLDNLVQVEQPAGLTTMTYDLAGRKTTMTDPDLGTWRYSYFRNSLLRQQTDACANVITLSYNNGGRLTSKSMAAGANCPTSKAEQRYATVYFTYGSNHSATNRSRGKLTAIIYTYDVYQKTLTYNAKGQLASEKTVIAGAPRFSYSTQYGYDAYDRPVTTTYPDGEVVATGYNSMGLATGITTTLGVTVTPVVNNAAYDAAGRLTHLNYAAAGVWLSYSYAPWTATGGSGNGRLLGIAAGSAPGAAEVMAAGYSYDSYGNPIRQTLTRSGLSDDAAFEYDDQNRLVSEQQAGLPETTYPWDAAGRLSAMAGLPLTYDSPHVHGVDTINGANRYDYDANGNVITRTTTAGVTQALKWDVENRLAAVVTGTITESYVYDPDGQRIRKQVGSAITAYPLPGYEQTGGTVTKHYSFGGQVVAVRDATGLYYLYPDRVGSTIHVTTQTGNFQASRGYTPYGEARETAGTMPTDRRYTSQRESATGLYYYGARWYDPETGQFVSPDTIVPDASNFLDYNRYLYARGNPLKYNDPTGHFSEEQLKGWYGDTWRDKFSSEWQQILLDTPGSQILGTQLGDVLSVVAANGTATQYVLVLSMAGNTPSLWNPQTKTATTLVSVGAQTPTAIGLYRIAGGETGQPSNYWSYLTGGKQMLPANNGTADSYNGQYQLQQVASAGQRNLVSDHSSIAVEWFMGRYDKQGMYVSNHSEFSGFNPDFPTISAGLLSAIGLGQMVVQGITFGNAAVTIPSSAITAYQATNYQDVYQMQQCSSILTTWCR